MAYEKRLCVLKQTKKGFSADGGPLTGAVYAERLGGDVTLTPKIAGLTPLSEGRYALVAGIGGKTFCLELKGNLPLRIPAAPPLKGGFSVLLAFVRGEAEPIAFGSCGAGGPSAEELLAALSERKRPIPVPLPPNQTPIPSPNVPWAPGVPLPEEDAAPFRGAAYDDEAIAAADYYVRDGDAHEGAARKGEAEADGTAAPEDEADGTVFPFRLSRGGLTYYNRIAGKLKEAFRKYPSDEKLLGAFPHSEWVRTERALLGVIYAEGVPRYLCVAMEKVPEEVKEHAIFVPISCFCGEEGVFVVFQDADTGDYVHVENA